MIERLYTNARVMTCDPRRKGLGIIDNAALAIDGDRFLYVGPATNAPPARERIDLRGRLVTPGLVDCHTHAVFGGDRANEFGMRASGATYLEIAAAGGGIVATLGPTRAMSEAQHVDALARRLDETVAFGTTTIEVKSGYDLTFDGELELLRAIQQCASHRRQRVVPTLLAHLIPPERAADRDAFVVEIAERWIPEVARGSLATSVDVYCDRGAFTLADARRILTAAKANGLAVRGHIGQFEDLGAAHLLAELGALSADHLEAIDDAGIAALARAGTVGVMLPGACIQVRCPVPPVDKLRRAGVRLAIATDLNPGSSYCESLLIQLWLATTHYGMTLEEAWLGVTRHAAAALAIDAGTIESGKRADLVIWRTGEPAEIPYRYAAAPALVERVIAGGIDLMAK